MSWILVRDCFQESGVSLLIGDDQNCLNSEMY